MCKERVPRVKKCKLWLNRGVIGAVEGKGGLKAVLQGRGRYSLAERASRTEKGSARPN